MQTTQDKKDTDINGYERRYDVPMTKIGVFPYLGNTISPELEPDKIYQVLRPEEELTNPETLKSLENIPFVDEHTMIGDGFTLAEEKGIHGVTGDNVKVNGDLITNDLIVYSQTLKDLIDGGKRDLSMGYRCKYDLTPGEYKGQHYDAIQRDIRFNHIALVDEGRMGSECRVTDNAIVYDSLDIKIQNKKIIMDLKKEIRQVLDEDLKQELKEEIKKELLDGGEEVTETKTEEEIVDEVPPEEEKPATDGEDKRKLIDEIGGILNGKVDEEILRTVMQKAEELAYNPSETGANDCNGAKATDEEPAPEPEKKDDDKKEGLSMDAAIKYIAKRDELVNKIRPVIGDNYKYSSMNIDDVVKYACDKLDIPNSQDRLEGYLAGLNKSAKASVKVTQDSFNVSSDFMQAYKSKN